MSNSNSKMIRIILIAYLAYLLSYMGRSNYSACILEIVSTTGIARSAAGSVSSAFAICNAIGQLLSTIIINKYSPIKVIQIELLSVALINLFFPTTDSFIVMAALWGVNGFMQSTLLCGLTKIFSLTLKEPYLSKGAVLLNTVGATGGAINYVLSWFIIRFFNWRFIFILISVLLFTLSLIWYIIMPKLTSTSRIAVLQQSPTDKKSTFPLSKLLSSHAAFFAITASMFVGLLRESVSLWIPTYMNDIYTLDNDLSVIITAFVPCLQVCGALLAGFIGNKQKNENIFLFSCLMFLGSGLSLIVINFLNTTSIILTLILFIINAICTTASLTFLVSLYPIKYFDKNNVVLIVGFSNFFVHLGDFISSFGIGWLSQTKGWMATFIILACLAFFASGLCFVGAHLNKKEKHKYV